jgi:OmpA-OmpF porin, OOP family
MGTNTLTRSCGLPCLLGLLASLALLAAPLPGRAEPPGLAPPTPFAFEAGTDKLTPASDAALAHVRSYLAAKPEITLLRIEGHVDEGDPAATQALSEKRALRVAERLVALGVDCKRLLPVGFGATKPVASGATPEGRMQNTRIALEVAMLLGRMVGGMPIDGGGRLAGDPCATKP